jgi:hypothetical protein
MCEDSAIPKVIPRPNASAHAGQTGDSGGHDKRGTRMELLAPLPRTFMNLLREDAGMSFMEVALIGALVMVVCLLLLLAIRRSA